MATDEDVAGWMSRSQPWPGWSQPSPVLLSLSELNCAALALLGQQVLWEMGKGEAGLGG